MTAPTEEEIRAALLTRLHHPTDQYARDADWIAYLSDGLANLFPPERLPNGDRVTSYAAELEAIVEVATPHIAALCHEVAIRELTALARAYPASPDLLPSRR